MKFKRKNLLLLTIDAFRLDHLSYTGYKKKTTPYLDKLCRKGFFFNQMIVNGPCTPPSFSSMFTSTYPFHQGGYSPLPHNKTTLAEVLKSHGYKTVAIHSTPLLSRFYGYDRGFDIFYDGMMSKDDSSIKKTLLNRFIDKGSLLNDAMNFLQSLNIPKRLQYYVQVAFYTKFIQRKEYYENAKTLLQKAFRWMKKYKSKQNKKPYFLWVHLMEPHDPYFPYNRFLKKVKARGLTIDEIEYIREHPEYMEILREYKMVNKLIDLYDAEIRYLDARLRRFFRKLNRKNRKWLKNTLTVITADHGEEFLDHGMFGHQAQLYDEILRVPLIFISNRLKKIKSKRFGKDKKKNSIRNIVNMRDFSPTILELLGLPQEENFDGSSFANFIFSPRKKEDDLIENGVFSETYHKNKVTRFSSSQRDSTIGRIISYRTPKYKYIIDEESMKEELYDLENDPSEKSNIVKKHPDLASKFKSKIIKHLKQSKKKNLKEIVEKKKISQAIGKIKINI
ncbi:MAG: sulfatase-like hydrolase/transferase [Candidatus Lokiarchaeota archaeon]|nr:sulfatase-like hydrolase/transferase [Candidatus Lokiarchaeota archaeon]